MRTIVRAGLTGWFCACATAPVWSAGAAAEPAVACSVVVRVCAATQSAPVITRPVGNPVRDRTKTQLERAQRQANVAAQADSGGPLKLDRVEIEGEREVAGDVVKRAFERHLPPPPRAGIEEWVTDNGARCTINHDCRGIFCGAVCTQADGTMGTRSTGSGDFNIIQR